LPETDWKILGNWKGWALDDFI